MIDQRGELIENLSQEDSLVKEVKHMLGFVKKNRECLNQALDEG
jgi:hypothetical protein